MWLTAPGAVQVEPDTHQALHGVWSFVRMIDSWILYISSMFLVQCCCKVAHPGVSNWFGGFVLWSVTLLCVMQCMLRGGPVKGRVPCCAEHMLVCWLS
jgi:hypothetical protein